MNERSGFYGTDVETYYLAAGRAWIIQSEDDLGTDDPVEIKPEDVPAEATECGDLMTPDEIAEQVGRIETAFGVDLSSDGIEV